MGRKRRIVARKKSPRYVIRSIRETRRILVYLRNPRLILELGERPSGRIPSCRSSDPACVNNSGSAGFVIGFMVNTSFLKETGNYLIQRGVLDAHVDHGITVEDRAQDLGDASPFNLEVDNRVGATGDFSEATQVFRRWAAVEMELHQFGLAELFADLG